MAMLIVSFWPDATAPAAPCAYQGAVNRDPTLPPCPPDAANYAGIAMVMLTLLWAGGGGMLLVAFGLSRLGARLTRHRVDQVES